MITSLIDFSFIRSLVADCYSEYGPPCYDPPSLFLLDLFRYIDGYQNMSKFLELLRDNDRGRFYRTHAGILDDIFPVKALSPFLEHDWAKISTMKSSMSWWISFTNLK